MFEIYAPLYLPDSLELRASTLKVGAQRCAGESRFKMGQPHHGEKRCAMNTSSMTTQTGLKESAQAHGLRQKKNQYIYPPACGTPHPHSTSADQPASQPACLHPPPPRSNLLSLRPLSRIRQLGTAGTLLPLAVFGNQDRQSGQFVCYELDELLISKLRIENLEVLAG